MVLSSIQYRLQSTITITITTNITTNITKNNNRGSRDTSSSLSALGMGFDQCELYDDDDDDDEDGELDTEVTAMSSGPYNKWKKKEQASSETEK